MISIIVSSFTLKRINDIKELLVSIHDQSSKNFELVYVTEGSENLCDTVSKIVRDIGIDGKVIHNYGKPGLSEARNIGISSSKGEILGFVDDDVVLDPDWSLAVEKAFKSFDEIIGVTGPAYPIWIGKQADWLPIQFDWLIGCTRWFKSDKPTEVRNCWGMNMCFSRSAIEKAGLFSTDAGYHRGEIAEDVELSLRVRRFTEKKLFYIPDMKVWNRVHSYRLSNRFIMERSSWIGHSRKAIARAEREIPYHQLNGNTNKPLALSTVMLALEPNSLDLWKYLLRLKVITLSLISLTFGYCFGPFGEGK